MSKRAVMMPQSPQINRMMLNITVAGIEEDGEEKEITINNRTT